MAVDKNIQKKANDIRTKQLGREVRESLASGLEEMSKDVVDNESRQTNIEGQWQSVIKATTDKDFNSAPEITASRVGADGSSHDNLKQRLDAEQQSVTAQLAQNAYYHEVATSSHYDEQTNTNYYLTLIKHEDSNGDVIEMKRAVTTGKTAREFAGETGSTLTVNASTYDMETLKVDGISIENGVVTQELPRNPYNYVLAFKEDNTMKAFPPNESAQSILGEGYTNALTAFIPLLQDGVKSSSSLYSLHHMPEIHPRQAIAQFENKDILFFTCGGRGKDGEGMTAEDVYRILVAQNVRFAYMLDGGGSTQTVLKGTMINKPIDVGGYVERNVPDFLYFSKSVPTKKDQDIVNTNTDVGFLNKKITDIQMDVSKAITDLPETKAKANKIGTFLKNPPDAVNLNTLGDSGIYWAGGGDIGVPSSSNSWVIQHIRHSANNAMQIAFPYNSLAGVKPKIRRTKVGGWDPWWDF